MTGHVKLPVGIENFEDMRRSGYYYIDKTGLIEQLMKDMAKVSLFTRPRRFGKTLNMSMLRYFFEIGTDRTLFDGLRISQNKELCDSHMGQYPVIFLTLKDVDGLTFDEASGRLGNLIVDEAIRHEYLRTSDRVSDEYRNSFELILSGNNSDPAKSLKLMSQMLYQHHGRKTVLIIDEYDVPLDKAFNHGYYREMVSLIRGMFGQALKTNDSLQLAVLTGCLRISKESIFTGLNNFKVLSIADTRYDEQFGFTDTEVKQLLADYGLSDHYDEMKEWYDGYHFGNADIYCPWDVINHVDLLRDDPKARPRDYWINTSSNDLVKRFVNKADRSTRDEIERLVAGEEIVKQLRLDLTYDEIDNSIENIWSVLYTTGYLTSNGENEDGSFRLVIPNREVRDIFVLQIQEWFRQTTLSDTDRINRFCASFIKGDAETIQDMLSDYLWDSISVRDTAVPGRMKENFYHGMLLGLLQSQGKWLIRSNAETGEGYSDITIATRERTGVVIEIKYAGDSDLEAACRRAFKQIEDKQYAEGLKRQGMKTIIKYGIAFHEKECMVSMA